MPIQTLEKVDFRKKPYRGIISAVARQQGVSQPAITKALKEGNLRITMLVADMIESRRREQRQEERELSKQMKRLEERP